MLLYPVGTTAACQYAARFLSRHGVTLVDHPTPEVTHLLLDIPSFQSTGQLRDGRDLEALLQMLPPTLTVIGGNLNHPALVGFRVQDLLKNEIYLARNAAITADCAIRVAAEALPITFDGCPVLVIGWGRIGKCLASILRALNAQVTVAARKETDRAMLQALGYSAINTDVLASRLPQYRLIYNTVPQLLLQKEQLDAAAQCLKIDLASQAGMAGDGVVWARGLPGIRAPEASGNLIAQTLLQLLREGTI